MTNRAGVPLAASCGVIAAAIAFSLFVAVQTSAPTRPSCKLTSLFSSSNGLAVGSDVDVSGVSVGRVTSIKIDEKSLQSKVSFSVNRDLRLPVDSALSVSGSSFAGSAILDIHPGRSSQTLAANSNITNTAPPGSIEAAIGDYVFGDGGLAGSN